MTTIVDDYAAIRGAMGEPVLARQFDAGDRHSVQDTPDLPPLLEELKELNRRCGPLSEASEKRFDERMNYILAAFEDSRATTLAGALAQLEFVFNPDLSGDGFEEANAAIVSRAVTTIQGLARCEACRLPAGGPGFPALPVTRIAT